MDGIGNKKKDIILFTIIGVLLIIIVILFFLLTNNDETSNELLINKDSNNSNEVSNQENTNKDEIDKDDNDIVEEDKEESNKNDQSLSDSGQNNDIKYTEDDVVSYFENMENEVTTSKWDNVKNKAKGYFITVVDFIFYDKEIKGYTFDELTGIAKLKVISAALKIDNKIEEKIPGYKESISSTTGKIYTNIKEQLIEAYFDVSTAICNSSPEGCNKAKEIFADIKDVCKISWDFIKKMATNGVSKLKDWYEIYSGK